MRLPPSLLRLAARQRHRASPELIRAVIEVASLLSGDLPVTVLPRVRRAVVIAPHPDDETLGCGGTIARLATAGTEVTVVLVTDGSATRGAPGPSATTGRERRAEATRACHHLGVIRIEPLGLPDGAVSNHLDALAVGVAEVLKRAEPGLVLLPWPLDGHPDHRAVAAALAGVQAHDDCDLWGYEVHTPILQPDRVLDVAAVMGRVDAALAEHVTAAATFDLTAVRGLTSYRSLATAAGQGHAEAFLTLAWEDLPAWVTAGAAVWARP